MNRAPSGKVERALSVARNLGVRHWRRALRVRAKLRWNEEFFHLLLAGAIGVLGGTVNLVFYFAIEGVKRFTLHRPGDLAEIAELLDWWQRLLIPALASSPGWPARATRSSAVIRTIDDLAQVLRSDLFASITLVPAGADSVQVHVMLRDPGAHPAYGMRSPASTTSAARDPVTGLDSLRSHAARQRLSGGLRAGSVFLRAQATLFGDFEEGHGSSKQTGANDTPACAVGALTL